MKKRLLKAVLIALVATVGAALLAYAFPGQKATGWALLAAFAGLIGWAVWPEGARLQGTKLTGKRTVILSIVAIAAFGLGTLLTLLPWGVIGAGVWSVVKVGLALAAGLLGLRILHTFSQTSLKVERDRTEYLFGRMLGSEKKKAEDADPFQNGTKSGHPVEYELNRERFGHYYAAYIAEYDD